MGFARPVALALALLAALQALLVLPAHAYISTKPPSPRLEVNLTRAWGLPEALPLQSWSAVWDPRGEVFLAIEDYPVKGPGGLGSVSRLIALSWNGSRLWSVAPPPSGMPAWKPDGSLVVLPEDKGIAAYTRDGRLAWTYHTGRTVRSAAWSPDGSFVAVKTYDGRLFILYSNGTLASRVEAAVCCYSWSPRSDLLFIVGRRGSDPPYSGYMVAPNGSILWGGLNGPGLIRIDYFAWSPDGSKIAVYMGAFDLIEVVSLDGRSLWKIDLWGSPDLIQWIDGGRELVVVMVDGEVRVYNGTGNVVAGMYIKDYHHAVYSLSPKGLIAVARGDNLTVYRPNGEALWARVARGVEPRGALTPLQVSWDPTGREVVVATNYGFILYGLNGTILAERLDVGEAKAYWSPDGSKLLVISSSGVLVYDRSGKLLWSSPLYYYSARWSPDGSLLVVNGGIPLLYSPTGALIKRLAASWVRSYAWSPKGRYLAVGSGGILLYSRSGALEWWSRGPDCCLAWSPDGKLVAGAHSGSLYVLNATNGKELWRRTSLGKILSVSWSPDGGFLAVSSSEALYIYRASGGLYKMDPSVAGGPAVWSPAEDLLAVAETGLGSLLVIDVTSYRTLWSAPIIVASMAWSPNGSYLAVAASGRRPTMWSSVVNNGWRLYLYTKSGKLLWQVEENETITALAWSPDSLMIAVATASKEAGGGFYSTLRIYNARTGILLASETVKGLVEDLAWSPKGGLLVVVGVTRVEVYKLHVSRITPETGVLVLEGRPGLNVSIAGPGGEAVYTIPPNGTLKIWASPGPYRISYTTPQGERVVEATIKPGAEAMVTLPYQATATKSTATPASTTQHATSPALTGGTGVTPAAPSKPGGAATTRRQGIRGATAAAVVAIVAVILAAAYAVARRR